MNVWGIAFGVTTGVALFTGGALRILGGSSSYDDVELVIRKSRLGDKVFGTATFEVLRHGSNVVMPYVSDPDTVERVFAERVIEPEEQYRRSRESHENYYLWDHWREDDPVPEEPVVEQDELGDILGVDIGDVDMDALDEADDMAEFDDLGDLGDVASDIGDAGGDGGGFDGGGGE